MKRKKKRFSSSPLCIHTWGEEEEEALPYVSGERRKKNQEERESEREINILERESSIGRESDRGRKVRRLEREKERERKRV